MMGIIRDHQNLSADEEVSSENLAKIEAEAWRIIDESKIIDPIAVEILGLVERFSHSDAAEEAA